MSLSRAVTVGLFSVALAMAARAADSKPEVVKFGKLSATAPAEWKSEKPANRLRSNQFKVLSGMEGVPDAEVYVMPDSDPNPDKSFPRWKASFVPPDGKTIDDIAKVTKFEIPGAKVQVLDITGTWKFKERPFDPKSKEELRPEYRVVWVIVETKDEAAHLRISGPAAVVDKHYPAFEKWIKSAK
ncbi:hypothetical protein [Fimbriiglobus ruber]|uniref:Serine/threonine protein kinase n=1 Tax=Fimbriiglobus ruber TaxID=1908690 RepID=A0A225DHF6_9BACT|nr:hypothetical protein [Fimbriiglobus ruber]OWK40920.1 hypothetical protein FRUB_04812 [Fimbriiglobus ruber]